MKKPYLCASLLLVLCAVFNASVRAQIPETLPQQINRIAKQRGISVPLFNNLIAQESSFRIQARSGKGAACLTQLMPDTARRFGLRVDSRIDERYDTEKCLQAGATYLAWLLNYFRGDVRLALAGYNAGEGAVTKYGNRIPPYRQTIEYVEKICYRTYGQAGHGVAMAYDQHSAYLWTANLYLKGRLPKNNPPEESVPAEANSRPLSSETSLVEPATVQNSAASVNSPKTRITRVATEAIQPKVRTESLYFWKQSQ